MATKYSSVDHDDIHLEGVVKAQPGDAETAAVPATYSQRFRGDVSDIAKRRSYRVNYWLLAATTLVLAITAPALAFWRNYQVRQNARVLVERAESKELEGDWRAAADFYHRYLQLVPGDGDALVARARAFDKSATTPDRADRAATILFQALDVKPDDVELRLRLAQRLMELGRWKGAQQQAERILTSDSQHLEAGRLAAMALRAQMGPTRTVTVRDVVEAHLSALEQHPGDPELSMSLALVYRENPTSFPDLSPDQVRAKADQLLDRMVEVFPDSEQTHLARFAYRQAFDLEGTDEDLARALAIAPTSPEVLRLAAPWTASSDPRKGLDLARQLVELQPNETASYQVLADVQSRLGNIDDAIQAIETGLAETGENNYVLLRLLLGTALDHGRLELAEATHQRLSEWLKLAGPYLQPADRRRRTEDLELAAARRQMLSGQAELAIATLRRLTTVATAGRDADQNLREQVYRWRLLAQAHAQLQQWDLAAQAVAEASRLQPGDSQLLLDEAGFARRAGDLRRALQLTQEAATRPGASPSVWLIVAERLIESEFQKGAAEPRNWRQVHLVLERARPALEGTPDYVSLRARWAIADSRLEDARKELETLLPVESIPLESATELALLFEVVGDDATADTLQQRLLDDPAFAPQGEVTRAMLIARRRDHEAARRLLDEYSDDDHLPRHEEVLPRLVSVEIEGGSVAQARSRLARWRDVGPVSLPLLDLGAALALQAGDWSELDQYIAALGQFEGSRGTVGPYYRALASLERRADGDVLDLVEARKILGQLEKLRPDWPSNWILKGRLADRQENPEAALTHYQEAVARGARSLLLIDWLVAGLYRQNRFAEAFEYLRRLGPIAGLSSELSGITLPAYLRQGRLDEALRLARLAAELHPRDPLPQMLYGQALAAAGNSEQASEYFQRAVELAPHDTRTWSGLVWFHAWSARPDLVRETLRKVAVLSAIPPHERALVAARGLAIIGDTAAAAEQFRKAIEAQPDDPVILEEAANLYLRVNLDRSLELYRRVLALSPNSANARRGIALIMGMRGAEEGLEEAIELLRSGDPAGMSELDVRLQIALLIRGTLEQQMEAVERLEHLIAAQEEVQVIDRLLLAQAYEQVDRPEDAEKQYEALVEADPNAEATALYIAFLLKKMRYEDAAEWLEKLELQDEEGLNPFSLRMEWLAGQDRFEEFDRLAEEFAAERLADETQESQPALQLLVTLLNKFDRLETMERVLSKYADVDPDNGGDAMVRFLIGRSRSGEAFRLAIDAARNQLESRPPLALVHVMTVLAAQKTPQGLLHEDAEALLSRGRKLHAMDVRFLFDLGTLRVMQGRDDDAIDLYEQTLALHPEFLPALNNLAIVLSDIPERQTEALAMMQRLLSLSPDATEVQDSYALVLLGCERYNEARAVLDALVQSEPNQARYRFHLAVVLDRLGEQEGAREALDIALRQGVENELLTPAEEEFLRSLIRKYPSASERDGHP